MIESLSKDCNLRATDAFEGYAAKINIELYLYDLGAQAMTKTIIVGEPDLSKPPTHRATVEIPLTAPDEARERSGLAEASTVLENTVVSSAKKRRYYAPRRRAK